MSVLSILVEEAVQKAVQALVPVEMEGINGQNTSSEHLLKLRQLDQENKFLKDKIATLERLNLEQAIAMQGMQQPGTSASQEILSTSTKKVAFTFTSFENQSHDEEQESKNTPGTSSGNQKSTAQPGTEHEIDEMKPGCVCTCGMEFPNKSKLNTHLAYYQATYKFNCNRCPTRFVYATDMRKHMKSVHKMEPEPWMNFGCRLCGKLFIERKELVKHRKTAHSKIKHGLKAREQLPMKVGEKFKGRPKLKFVCHCGEEFDTKKKLLKHAGGRK